MIAFDDAKLPAEERALLDLVARVPGWRAWPSAEHVDVTRAEVSIRFAAGTTPLLIAPRVPEGYSYALAMFTWHCTRFGAKDWWMPGYLSTADQWSRSAVADYVPHWASLTDWIRIAPAPLLDVAREAAAALRPQVTTDAAARTAAIELRDGILSSQQHSRLSGFLTHLDAPQSAVAQQMLADGWEIGTFWGPEQMDVWSLTLRRGPVAVVFGIERGFSYGITVDHDGFRERRRGYGPPAFGIIRQAWARRTKLIRRAADPFELDDRYDEWRQVLGWLTTAKPEDVRAIDRFHDAVIVLRNSEYSGERTKTTPEQRIAAAEAALR